MGRKKKDQRWSQEEEWDRPSHPDLVAKVKRIQRTSEEGREAWAAHCKDKSGVKDPAKSDIVPVVHLRHSTRHANLVGPVVYVVDRSHGA